MLTPDEMRAVRRLEEQAPSENTFSPRWHHENPEPRHSFPYPPVEVLENAPSARFVIEYLIDPASNIRRLVRTPVAQILSQKEEAKNLEAES
jgi:hypothetical protein